MESVNAKQEVIFKIKNVIAQPRSFLEIQAAKNVISFVNIVSLQVDAQNYQFGKLY